MEFNDVVAARHSVRDFVDRPVGRDVLDQLTRAASLAPSSLNEQPWKFYIAVGETRGRIGQIMSQSTVYLADYIDVLGPERYEEASRWYTDLGGAPVVIGVTMPRTEEEATLISRAISVGAAVENMLLAATELGLGSCVITFSFWVRDELAEAFGVEEDQVIVGLIALGYPGKAPEAPEHSPDVAVFRE